MKISATMDARSLTKEIEKAVRLGYHNNAEMRKAYRRVAAIYIATAKGMIRDHPDDILVQRGHQASWLVESGTLRRSMGTWNADKTIPTILAGPRANAPMKKKVKDHSDAWFAGIVEEGDFPEQFGGKSSSHPNYKVMSRAMAISQPKMKVKLYQELRKEFERYMKTR
jgi:hypothetical protein